jgi:DNA invertase Pin-like site-specific DNA recombinase
MNTSELVKTQHLERRAIIYIRQSSPHQVLTNQESLKLQYALKQRALELGWHEKNIEVIDSDLGLTGSTTEGRYGFKDLLAQVTLGEVGAVFSYEVTRLSRNCSDWYPLLDICGIRCCLIGDRDGIYDPSTPNGRLLLGLKGQISEMELHTLKGRLTAGLINKAKRGELALKLPVGYTRDRQGNVFKDPNLEVQSRILVIFEKFLRVRSASKVLRYLNTEGLSIPRTNHFGDVVWKPPTIAAILTILKSPVYAGVFVYGRTRATPKAGFLKTNVQKKIPTSEWKVRIDNKYPAYISLEMHEKIQAMLKDNYAEYDRNKTRGIPRPGKALLHGIVYCGECGHKMMVQYKPGTRYLCNHLRQQTGVPVCQFIPADPVDDTVVSAFFEVLSPVELDMYAKAMSDKKHQDENLNRSRMQQLERLRYQATLAERQFNQVDPDNRLVAAELERRWESALHDFKQAEGEFERESQAVAIPLLVTQKIKNAFQNIGKNMPEVWQQDLLSQDKKKAFLRCLIDKVIIRRSGRDVVDTRIVWKGGDTTTVQIPITVGAFRELSFSTEMENLIIDLSKSKMKDKEIALLLTEKGFRSPLKKHVLPSTVQTIRLKHGLFHESGHSCSRKIEGFLTLPQIAKAIGVTPYWIYDRINKKQIRVVKIKSDRYKNPMYLFPDLEETTQKFFDLKNGIIDNLDFS